MNIESESFKTGSLCCVAARPHGSAVSNDGWSTAPYEPHWRSNGGFSPPLSSTRWDSRVQPEDLPTTSQTYQLRHPSFSSSGRGSRSGSRIGSASFLGNRGFFSRGDCLSDSFRTNVWNPLASPCDHLGEVSTAGSDPASSPSITINSSKEGCLSATLSTGSNTSDIAPSYPVAPVAGTSPPSSSHRRLMSSFSVRSKPTPPTPNHALARQASDSRIHAVGRMPTLEGRRSFHRSGSSGDSSAGGPSDWWSMHTFSELVASSRQERLHWTSASSPSDFGWGSTHEGVDRTPGLVAMERIRVGNSHSATSSPPPEACGVCTRLLSQRSPFGSYRMAGSADCTVVGVLVCGHVYHAECLEQATPESLRQDPTCPQCGTGDKSATKVGSLEPLALRGGGGFRGNGSLARPSSKNKLSRIGVVPDDFADPEFTSSSAGPFGGKGASAGEGGKLRFQADPSQSEHLGLSKPLTRKHLSFRNQTWRESSADMGWRRPASPARVSPDTSQEDSSIPVTKKGRLNSFRLMRKR